MPTIGSADRDRAHPRDLEVEAWQAERTQSVLGRWILLLLLMVGVVLPLVLGALSGAIAVPVNDDWAYRRVALNLYQTGQLRLTGWEGMTLIGQVLAVQPLLWLTRGDGISFAAAAATFAGVAIVASYLLARRLLSPGRALLALLTVLFVPGFLVYATSFMTDVPAYAAAMVCLLLGAVALARSALSRHRWLAASFVAGCAAFSIREFTLAAPVAVAVAALALGAGRTRTFWVTVVLAAVTCGVIYVATTHVSDRGSPSVAWALTPQLLGRTRDGIATLAFMLAPTLAITVAQRWRTWRPLDVAIGVAVGAFLFGDYFGAIIMGHGIPSVLIGNVFDPAGAHGPGLMAGGRPSLYPPAAWDAFNAVALAAGIAALSITGGMLGATWRHRRSITTDQVRGFLGSTAGLLAVFSLLYGGGLVAVGLVFPLFDRYLWVLVVPMSALLLMRPTARPTAVAERRANRVGTVAMGGLATMSLMLLLNHDAFAAAAWRMGNRAVALGIPAGDVDAGFAWVGYHAAGGATANAAAGPGEDYYHWFPAFHACAVVSSSFLDRPDLRLAVTAEDAYRLMLFGGAAFPLYLYRVTGAGCP
jgi:hypothetical protein